MRGTQAEAARQAPPEPSGEDSDATLDADALDAVVAARALGSEAWAAVIKTNHGGLKLRPKEATTNALQTLHRRARQWTRRL